MSTLYGAIYADPPWSWKARSPKGEDRSAVNHYGVMSLDAIKALPVADMAAKDAVLFLWAIDSMLPLALEVIEAYDFQFKTVAFTGQRRISRAPASSRAWVTGLGAIPNSACFATRGSPKRLNKDVRQLIVAPRREHSRKPDEVRERIERLVLAPIARCSLDRGRRAGNVAFSDELPREVRNDNGGR